jgi:hypothetical protein
LPPKLSYQVNVRLSPEQYEAIERRPVAEITRLLIEFALPQLGRPGTIASLTTDVPARVHSKRVSEETQNELHAALDLLFENAPSTVIERVAEYLTEKAGKYTG